MDEIRLLQRNFRGRGAQVPAQHVRIAGMDDSRIDGSIEDDLGMVDDVGVQRVVTGDEYRHPPLSRTPGPTSLLPQRCQSSWPPGDDDEVEAGDVDPELQRIRRRHRQQSTRAQCGLEQPALLGEVAAAIGRNLVLQRVIDLAHLVSDR